MYVLLSVTENVDECASDPCQNNGTCVDMADAFLCVCVSAYGGVDCASK